MGPDTVVLDDDNHVAPGSGVVGRMARGGNVPLRYHKDPEKSAATFVERRRQALLGPRRLRHGRGRRHDDAARPRLGVHQLRRREDLSRRGRGGAQGAPDGVRRGGRRRSRRALGRTRRRGRAASRAARRRRSTSSTRTAARSSPATRCPASCTSSTRSSVSRAASPTTRGRTPSSPIAARAELPMEDTTCRTNSASGSGSSSRSSPSVTAATSSPRSRTPAAWACSARSRSRPSSSSSS